MDARGQNADNMGVLSFFLSSLDNNYNVSAL